MSALNLPANPFISVFDFRLQFDLQAGQIKIDLSPSVIIDASGISVDVTILRPDRVVTNLAGAFTPATINQIVAWGLPKIQGVYMWGLYTVKCVVNVNGSGNPVQYTLVKTRNLCAPDAQNPYSNDMTGTILLTVDCARGTLTASGFCGYGYMGQTPIEEDYNITRYYPPEAELLPQKNLSIIPFVVDAYIGLNTVKGLNVATYDFGDNVFVILRIVATATKNVRCGIDFETIYCGMAALLDQMYACNASPQDFNVAFGEINALLWTATTGINENKDVEAYISRLETLLGVDCRCASCAGDKVGPTCVPACPQVSNATAIVDTTVTPLQLKISYVAMPPIGDVNIQIRAACPGTEEPWVDQGNWGGGDPVLAAFDIDEPLTYEVKLTSIVADGTHCEPVTILAIGNCPQVVGINVPPPPATQPEGDFQIVELIVGHPELANPAGAPTPAAGDQDVILQYDVSPFSENIFLQGVPVRLFPSFDFNYEPLYQGNQTTYHFSDPLQDGNSIKFDFAIKKA